MAISTTAIAQQPTEAPTKNATQTALEARVKTIQQELAAIATALGDAADTSRFSPAMIDSVYAAQRVMEDISYDIYERTDYPPAPVDSVATDSTAVSDDDSDTPPSDAPSSPWGRMKKPKSPRTILRVGYAFGSTDLSDFSERIEGYAYPVFDFSKSGFWSWQFMLETRLGQRDTTNMFPAGFNPKKPWKRDDQFKENRWSLRVGLTIDRNRARETSSKELLVDNGGGVRFEPFQAEARTNDIAVWSLTMPVLMQAKFGKNTIAQAGVFGGLRTGAYQRLTYGEGNYELERSLRDDFGLAKFTYGLMVGFGLDGLYFTGKFCLNPFFKENSVYDYRLFSYGLTISM